MILVTGAAGVSGTIAVRELARQKVAVRALVRRLPATPVAGVEYVLGDIAKPGAALDGVRRAFLISSTNDQMVATQCAFIDAAKQAGVEHVIKMSGRESGIGFDADAFSFLRMHVEIERHLEASGLAYTQLQPSQFMQVYLRDVRTISKGELVMPMASAQLAPVDLEDVAKIAARILRDGDTSGSYTITGPQALTLTEIAEQLARAIGRPVRYVDIDPDAYERILAGVMPPAHAHALAELFAERRKCPLSRIDLTAHTKFDVRPTPFLEFAARHAAAFRGEVTP